MKRSLCKKSQTRDRITKRCRKKKSPGPKRKSRKPSKVFNRSTKRKSPKRKSPKRKSPKSKSPKRKSPKRKSRYPTLHDKWQNDSDIIHRRSAKIQALKRKLLKRK